MLFKINIVVTRLKLVVKCGGQVCSEYYKSKTLKAAVSSY